MPLTVDLEFLPLHCPLKMNMGLLLNLTTLVKPVVHDWHIGGFAFPWDEGGLVSQDALEGGEVHGGMGERILCMLSQGEERCCYQLH